MTGKRSLTALMLLGLLAMGYSAPATAEPAQAYVLHLPGIGGTRAIDQTLVAGLRQGGLDAQYEIYDWTDGDAGIDALQARQRNQRKAAIIADKLTAQYRTHPDWPIYLTCHSAGNGLAVWALEQLPADVKIKTLLMLAPALSPTYDLSKALSHVQTAYVFYSANDNLVLGMGTRLFGTVDGVKCDAAGLVGFTPPASADPQEYRKLVSEPYNSAWIELGNMGDHVGTMGTRFARQCLAPLLREGTAAPVKAASTTRPASPLKKGS